MTFLKVEDTPRVRDLPLSERPVNRLRCYGPGALSTTELIASVVRCSLNQSLCLFARRIHLFPPGVEVQRLAEAVGLFSEVP
jgi:hypothetical protein